MAITKNTFNQKCTASLIYILCYTCIYTWNKPVSAYTVEVKCVYICEFVCLCVLVHVHIHCMCVHVCWYVCRCTVYMYVGLCAYTLCVCMLIYVHIHCVFVYTLCIYTVYMCIHTVFMYVSLSLVSTVWSTTALFGQQLHCFPFSSYITVYKLKENE